MAGGLAPMPITGAGATPRVQSTTGAPPAVAALASNRPIDAARLTRAELRVDAASRAHHRAADLAGGSAARALTRAGRACVLRHDGSVLSQAASTFALRGPPPSA